MKLHESRPPVSYIEENTISKSSTSNSENNTSSKKDSPKNSEYKIKEVTHLKKINSKTPVTSVHISCNQEEVVRIERMDSTEKVSISTH